MRNWFYYISRLVWLYGFGHLRLRKMKGLFKHNEIKTNNLTHDPLEAMGLYLLLRLFKFYVINFCFAKISISAFDLIYCKLLILIWIQVLFLTFWVFFFYIIHQTYVLTTYKSCLLKMHINSIFIKNIFFYIIHQTYLLTTYNSCLLKM